MSNEFIAPQKFDRLFEKEENLLDYLDFDSAGRRGLDIRRVSVDFPEWMINMLDQEAKKIGISRQSVIKFWVAEKLKSL